MRVLFYALPGIRNASLYRVSFASWHELKVAFAPGKVIGYERNVHTIEELSRNNFQIIQAKDLLAGLCEIPEGKCVITIPGSELARGGGGARCMSMPIRRKSVNW